MRPSGESRRWQRARAVVAVAWKRWLAPQSSLFAAALAFQALLAMAPMLLVLLMVAGRLLGRETTEIKVRFSRGQPPQSLTQAVAVLKNAGFSRVMLVGPHEVKTSSGEPRR